VIDRFTATVRLVGFVVVTLVMLVPYLACLGLGRGHRRVQNVYWGWVLRHLIEGRLLIRGRMVDDRPLLLVSNHTSYLDIAVLGSLVPGAFVSKAEVRDWPGIGFLAKVARTVFVDRRPSSTGRQRDEIRRRLGEGEPLILFPEGTSSDGNRVLPFRSALFNVAEREIDGRPVVVQPVAIAYTLWRGLPMGYMGRAFYAWYGDMELVDHLWTVMVRGPFTVEVAFLPPVAVTDFPNRKALARDVEGRVAAAHNAMMCGRAANAVDGPTELIA